MIKSVQSEHVCTGGVFHDSSQEMWMENELGVFRCRSVWLPALIPDVRLAEDGPLWLAKAPQGRDPSILF